MATLNDLTDGYNAVSVALLDGAGTAAATTFKSLGSWRDEDIPRFIDELSPQLIGFKQKAAQAALAYNGQVAAIEGKPFVQPSLAEIDLSTEALRNGTNVEDVYRRPFVQMRMALAKNPLDFPAALNTGTLTARSLARTEVQLSRRQVSLFARKYNKNVVGYLRTLTGMESCALCYVASTQRYHKGDLLPIHPGCDCGEMPIYGDSDPGQIIDKQLLEKSHEAVGERFGSIARTARGDGEKLPDYNKIMVEDHGEMGPMLTVKGQGFTGPNDLSLKGKSMPVAKAPTAKDSVKAIQDKAKRINGQKIQEIGVEAFQDISENAPMGSRYQAITNPRLKGDIVKQLDAVKKLGADVDSEISRRLAEKIRLASANGISKDITDELEKAKIAFDDLLAKKVGIEQKVRADTLAQVMRMQNSQSLAEAESWLSDNPFGRTLYRANLYGTRGYKPLISKVTDAEKAVLRLSKAVDDGLKPGSVAYRTLYSETVKELLNEVRGVGGVGPELVGSTKTVKETISWAFDFYPTEWLEAAANKIPQLNIGKTTRGYFEEYESKLMISTGRAMRIVGPAGGNTAVHEIGHLMEHSVPGIKALEWAYNAERAAITDFKTTRLNGGGTAFTDEWANPYTGRNDYGSGPRSFHEVFTTGVESVLTGSEFFERKTSVDDEFRQFILGVLFGL